MESVCIGCQGEAIVGGRDGEGEDRGGGDAAAEFGEAGGVVGAVDADDGALVRYVSFILNTVPRRRPYRSHLQQRFR